MNEFSIGGAWSQGYRFFAGRWLLHALILIAGVLIPFGLNHVLPGGEAVRSGPGPTPMGARMFDNPEQLLVLGLGFLAQSGSYFASWRLGLDERRSLPGALLFGLLAGLVTVICLFLAYFAAGYMWLPLLSYDTLFLAVFVFLLPLILVSAIFFVAGITFAAAVVIVYLLYFMIYGATQGQVGFAASMVGGSGSIVVLLLILSGVTFWLAARMSCVAVLMAEWRSLNLFAAIRQSWQLTWEEQWAITRYLALVGGILAALLFGASLAIGFSSAGMVSGAEEMFDGVAGDIIGLAIAIPFAFLAVGLPGGIYRQIVGEETPAEIFD